MIVLTFTTMNNTLARKISILLISLIGIGFSVFADTSFAASSTLKPEVQKSIDTFLVNFEKKLSTYKLSRAITIAKNTEKQVTILVTTKFSGSSDVKAIATALTTGIQGIRARLAAKQIENLRATPKKSISTSSGTTSSSGTTTPLAASGNSFLRSLGTSNTSSTVVSSGNSTQTSSTQVPSTQTSSAPVSIPAELQASTSANSEFQSRALASLKTDWKAAIDGSVVPNLGDSMVWAGGTLERMRYGNDGGIKLVFKGNGGSWYVCNDYYNDPVRFAVDTGGGAKFLWAEQYGVDFASTSGGQLGNWTSIMQAAITANFNKKPFSWQIGGNNGVTAVVRGDDANLNTPLNEIDANKNVYVTYNGKTVTANEFLKTNWYHSIVGTGN